METKARHLFVVMFSVALFSGALLGEASTSRAAGWQSDPLMPRFTGGAAAESIDGIVYVTGGRNSNGVLGTLQAYDPTTKKWSLLARPPGGRYDGNGAGVINGQLYVAGGWTLNPALPNSNLWVYDPPSNTWTGKASMSHRSGCGATGAIRGELYVATACNGKRGYRNDLDVYDPVTDGWTRLSGSKSAHANGAFGVINDKLYLAGGDDDNGVVNVLEVYDPLANAWTKLAPMPTPVVNPGSVSLNGLLYVFGGSNGKKLIDTVQIYNPFTNAWRTSATSLPIALETSSAAIDYGIVFLDGGYDASGTAVRTNYDLVITPSIP